MLVSSSLLQGVLKNLPEAEVTETSGEKSPSLAKAAFSFSAQVHEEFSSEVQVGSLSRGMKYK